MLHSLVRNVMNRDTWSVAVQTKLLSLRLKNGIHSPSVKSLRLQPLCDELRCVCISLEIQPFSFRLAGPDTTSPTSTTMELPTLGSILSFLGDLYSKYEVLDDSNELCKSLHERLRRFLDMLSTIDPATIEANGLLSSLSKLVNEFSAAVNEYADLDCVSRWLRPNTFPDNVKVFNERLDGLCLMGLKEATNLLEWRSKYEQDVANALSSSTHGLRDKIRKALDDDNKWPSSKIEELVLFVKRDLPESPVSMRHKRQQLILEVAEEHFLSGKKLDKPPSWLIAANELSSYTEAIAKSEFAEIVVRKWQGAQVAVKKLVVAVDTNPVFEKQFTVWRTLLHPNVAQLYGVGTDRGAPFFVYEYASKQSLDRCWGQLTPKELWGVLPRRPRGCSTCTVGRSSTGTSAAPRSSSTTTVTSSCSASARPTSARTTRAAARRLERERSSQPRSVSESERMATLMTSTVLALRVTSTPLA